MALRRFSCFILFQIDAYKPSHFDAIFVATSVRFREVAANGTDRTQNQKIRRVHSFGVQEEWITFNPAAEMKNHIVKARKTQHRPSMNNDELGGFMNRAIFKLGYDGQTDERSKAVPYGFRANASSILNEKGFHADAIERQLRHTHHPKCTDDEISRKGRKTRLAYSLAPDLIIVFWLAMSVRAGCSV